MNIRNVTDHERVPTDTVRRLEADVRVLGMAVAVMAHALDDLVGACRGGDGKPQAPDRGTLLKAQAMLPPTSKHAFRATSATGAQNKELLK